MPTYYVDGDDLTAIANAIRTKGGTSESLEFPDEFIGAINDISGGGITPSGTKYIYVNATGIDVEQFKYADVAVPASAVDSGTRSFNITQNGVMQHQDVIGYAYVNMDINVPNTYAAGDEGKVVSSGELVSQTSKNINSNGTVDTTLNNQVVVAVPNSYSASDEGKVVSNGALVSQSSDIVTQNGTVDTTLINSLTVEVSGGGGFTPPVNALAQFEVSATVTAQPSTMSVDFTDVCALMTANRTYVYSLILWRDDVVSASSYDYTVESIFVGGRIKSDGGLDTNIAYDFGTPSASMTSGVQLNTATLVSSKSVTNKVLSITLAGTSTRDRTGKWKGIFTLLPPWTDEYTGTKLTSCPTGFLEFS